MTSSVGELDSQTTGSTDRAETDDPLASDRASQQSQVTDDQSPGTLQTTPTQAVGIMAVWSAAVVGYSLFSGFNAEFVVVGVFVGLLVLLEVTTSNQERPAWHRYARVALVAGYVAYAAALISKFPTVAATITSYVEGLLRFVPF